MAKLTPQEFAKVEREREEMFKAGEVLSEVGDGQSSRASMYCRWSCLILMCLYVALKSGVVQIAQTFGHRLSAFKFPPRIANKLQGFVDYS